MYEYVLKRVSMPCLTTNSYWFFRLLPAPRASWMELCSSNTTMHIKLGVFFVCFFILDVNPRKEGRFYL